MSTPKTTPPKAFLQVDRLAKHFDEVKAVDHVSLDIEQGEIFALLGGSGCGKSTLLRMLAGFEAPSSGEIWLAGQALSGLSPYERPINMMFQSYALFPHLSVEKNIAFGLERDRLPRNEIEARVQEMLALVQIKPYAKRKPHQLSGGQQQRVALARSLAKRPRLLLLDEPLGALDKKLREQTQIELVQILKRVGVTCVMVTHDQEEAMAMADRIAIMREGQILQMGTPSDVYETPNCRYVADFVGSINLFAGTVTEDEADHVVIRSAQCAHYVSHGITGTQGMAVSVAVRPEKISLSLTEPQLHDRECPQELGHNQVAGFIKSLSYFGNFNTYHVECADGSMIRATTPNAARHEERRLKLGDRVWAWWDGSDVVVLTH
jgi:putrescine transport system ATP-binding protein